MPFQRLFTDTDMHDQALKEEMEYFYSYLQRIVRVDGLVIPSQNYDLVLDITPKEDNRIQWSYYYACHETRCLFWLDEYDAGYMTFRLHGVESLAHLSASLSSTSCSLSLNFLRRASPGEFILVHVSLSGLVPLH
jgi:hypothetical protein